MPGENPDFYSQIDDLENYVVHNKRAPINQREVKRHRVVHHVAGGPFAVPHSFMVETAPAQITDRFVVNEFDIEWFLKQAIRWDDLFVSTNNQIEDVRERITRFLANMNSHGEDQRVYGGSKAVSYFPWEDHDIWQVLENAKINEEEMILCLSRIPDDTLMYQTRWMKHQELSRLRIEIERWLAHL